MPWTPRKLYGLKVDDEPVPPQFLRGECHQHACVSRVAFRGKRAGSIQRIQQKPLHRRMNFWVVLRLTAEQPGGSLHELTRARFRIDSLNHDPLTFERSPLLNLST